MKEFNINEDVYLKLTKIGIAILKKRHEELVGTPYKGPRVDENGYTKMQLWEVMQIFGNYLIPGYSYGKGIDLPFETNIAIADEDLKDMDIEKGKSL